MKSVRKLNLQKHDVHSLVNQFVEKEGEIIEHRNCHKCIESFDWGDIISLRDIPSLLTHDIHQKMFMNTKIFVPYDFMVTYLHLINHHFGSQENHIRPEALTTDIVIQSQDYKNLRYPNKFIIQSEDHFVICLGEQNKSNPKKKHYTIYDPFYEDLQKINGEWNPRAYKYNMLFEALTGSLEFDFSAEISYPQNDDDFDCVPIACLFAESLLNENFSDDINKSDLEQGNYCSLMREQMSKMFDRL